MERQVGVSAVFIIMSLLIGAALAIPRAAIVQAVVGELLDEHDRLHDGRDPASG